MSAEALERDFEAEEAAAREARKAAFLAARQAAADEQARETDREARKLAARARRAELVAARQTLRAELRAKMGAMLALYEALSGAVAGIEGDVFADADLCREHNGLAAVAGERGLAEPLGLELVQAATTLEIGLAFEEAAPLHEWLRAASEPHWRDLSPEASALRRGAALLEQIRGTP